MASPVPPASSRSPMPPSPASPSCRSTLLTGLVGGFFVGVVATVALFICCGKKRGQPQSSGKRIFTFGELQRCTGDFSVAQRLGEGGSALVYKGTLSSGEDVAVKRLKKEDGGKTVPGFETEVENLSRAHHKHVVSLVGYCIAKTERILVYEYVPNNTLHFHLHGHGDGRGNLNWRRRLNLALGSAKGLAYLHESCYPKIIHRDIKATNILLDGDFEAKIADFGLAKCISKSKTHVTTNVKGTLGYLDPEYMSDEILTEKADVYSFGVVLWELITGRVPIGLVERVKPQLTRYLEDGIFDSLVDPGLQNNYNPDEMARMVQCAAACVHPSGERRPKMSKIVRALEGYLHQSMEVRPSGHPSNMEGGGEGSLSPSDLNAGEMPGLSRILSGCESSDCGTSQGIEMSKKTPLAIPEHGSGHHNKPTSGSRRGDPSRPTTQGRDLRRK